MFLLQRLVSMGVHMARKGPMEVMKDPWGMFWFVVLMGFVWFSVRA